MAQKKTDVVTEPGLDAPANTEVRDQVDASLSTIERLLAEDRDRGEG